jgi:hypothetical protein
MIPTHIFVTAEPGRLVPVPLSEASAPGATLLKCEEGKLYRVPWSTYTRRRIAAGDLAMVDATGAKTSDLQKAAAPSLEELEKKGFTHDDSGALVAKSAPTPAEKPLETPDTKRKG